MKKRKQDEDTGSEPSAKVRRGGRDKLDSEKLRDNSPIVKEDNDCSVVGSSNSNSSNNSSSSNNSKKKGSHVNGVQHSDNEDSTALPDVEMQESLPSKSSPKKRAASPRKNNKTHESTGNAKNPKSKAKSDSCSKLGIASSSPARKSKKEIVKEGEKLKGDKPQKKKKSNDIEEDEDSTDLDEDRKNIREAERALRSLSGEWEGQGPFFSYEENKVFETMFDENEERENGNTFYRGR